MLYFKNREQAGEILAKELFEKYRYEDCAVVALSDGGVIIGEKIAQALHCVLTMLLIEQVVIPGENINLGSVSQDGDFTTNSELSSGEAEYYEGEYHTVMDQQKQQAFQRINRLLGDGGLINKDMLRDRVIILVSDGLKRLMLRWISLNQSERSV
jgi:putative phosphoribosyl transferase